MYLYPAVENTPSKHLKADNYRPTIHWRFAGPKMYVGCLLGSLFSMTILFKQKIRKRYRITRVLGT